MDMTGPNIFLSSDRNLASAIGTEDQATGGRNTEANTKRFGGAAILTYHPATPST